MRLPEVSKTVQVPDNVTLSVDGKKINVQRRQRNINT
jgi:hypothetical protein